MLAGNVSIKYRYISNEKKKLKQIRANSLSEMLKSSVDVFCEPYWIRIIPTVLKSMGIPVGVIWKIDASNG